MFIGEVVIFHSPVCVDKFKRLRSAFEVVL